MKHLAVKFSVLIAFLMLPHWAMGFPNLPLADPPLETHIGWNLNANGLLYLSFDLDHNGQADYYTVHFVLKAYLTSEPLKSLPGYYHGAPVFYVNYGSAKQVYVISRKALVSTVDS
ncbi:MAG: hypothetical protein IIA63_03410 [Nitrospinae bacterium]|nr:hypothetical protein [Nitrospinota bacterium]